ncbi:MAG: WG repeat-containing protein [Bacteroides sp.]|nr:WG repeat-containing protein [Bacteroides sp.]MCM1413968.1 WG repeat-containing protein [Bacteroides sp.]MCM1471815.1 WG repeat-containing protein [Bacteroides sp.]
MNYSLALFLAGLYIFSNHHALANSDHFQVTTPYDTCLTQDIKITPEFSERISNYASVSWFENGYANVSQIRGNKVGTGLIDRSGNLVIPCEYFTIKVCDDGFIIASKFINNNVICGVLDYEGNVIIPFIYSGISYDKDGVFCVWDMNNKMAILKDNVLLTPWADSFRHVSTQFTDMVIGDKHYVCSKNLIEFKKLSPFAFEDITGCDEILDYCLVQRNGAMYSFDKFGNLHDESVYKKLLPEENGQIQSTDFEQFQLGLKFGIKNYLGETIVDPVYDYACPFNFGDSLFLVCKHDKQNTNIMMKGLLDNTGHQVLPIQYESIEEGNSASSNNIISPNFTGIAFIIKKNGKYGLYSRYGLIEPNFDSINLEDDGYAIVKKDKKYEIYRIDGCRITKEGYDYISSFHEGLAAASKGGRYGYIDKLGNDTFSIQ